MTSPERDDQAGGGQAPEPPEETADLLAAACARAGLPAEALDALTGWLARELMSDRFPRLEAAGHSVDNPAPLEHVFVDLAASEHPGSDHANQGGTTTGFVSRLCGRAPRRRAATRQAPEILRSGRLEPAGSIKGYALIGGPGQGKSTLGQLLCQLHRAGMLRPRLERLSLREHREAVEAFSGERARAELGHPAEVLFPVRITLAEAAAWLAGQRDATGVEDGPALLRYVTDRARCAMSSLDLERLLRRCDWLLVLDGLDEVPASSDRDRVLAAVRELIGRLLPGPSRGVLVATTRPQGYAGEFEDLGIAMRSLHLVPLSPDQALAYAERLAAVRFGYSSDRRERVLERLRQAAAGEATARLMRSPLQVTILFTLVDRIGRAPSERWTLFREYYRVVYEREMERPIEAAELLRSYRAHIDKIHGHVGLLLQVESESSGGTESILSPERFRQVVEAALAEDDIEGARREDLVDKLEAAVRDRLVLLVELRPGKLGFEIRSIQEFMAAWALSQKSDAVVEARLEQVSRAASFRNVVLFLASKAFTELSDLRDALVDRICPRLNEEPGVGSASLAGSVLALEILEEGAVLKQTKYVRKLVELCARLIERPPTPLHGRLAQACFADPDAARVAAPIFERAIKERLDVELPERRLGAWTTLIGFINEGAAWALSLAHARWGDDASVRRELLAAMEEADLVAGPWLWLEVPWTPRDFSPPALRRLSVYLGGFEAPWLDPLITAVDDLESSSRGQLVTVAINGQATSLSLVVARISPVSPVESEPLRPLAAMQDPPNDWRPWVAAARLMLDPSPTTLAETIEWMAEIFDLHVFRRMAKLVPWPLGWCLEAASSADDLRAMSARARSGDLGDIEAWRAAEMRWYWDGTMESEKAFSVSADMWPLRGRDQEPLFPITVAEEWQPRSTPEMALLNAVRDRMAAVTSAPLRRRLAELLVFIIRRGSVGNQELSPPFSPDEVRAIWSSTDDPVPVEFLRSVQPWRYQDDRWSDLLDFMGRSGRFVLGEDIVATALPGWIALVYLDDPRRTGLLHLLGLLAAAGDEVRLPRSFYDPARLPDDRACHSAGLVLLAQHSLSPAEAEALATSIAAASSPDYPAAEHLMSLLERLPDDSPQRERALLALHWGASPANWRLAARITNALTETASRAPSGLDDAIVWDRLHLPHPRPERRIPSGPPSSVDLRRPVAIDTITLENVRIFDELTLAPAPPADGLGQWIVILGKNGTGKSTLLRSLVFALVDVTSQPNRLPQSTFDTPWRRLGIDGSTSFSQVSVHGERYQARFAFDADRDKESLVQDVRLLSYPLFAYGCRRGSALGGASRRVNDEPGAEVPTLFDEGADLIHAETWLLIRENAAQKDAGQRRIYDAVLSAVLRLLPGVEAIESRGDRVWARGSAVGEVPLAALSDGYLTTLGWAIDLLARWIKRAEIRKERIEPDFIDTMTGLVLLDEIDLFLHPDWQRRVISDARRIFPRMSFVATTHNPLTLLGARAEEIWELRRGEDGRIVAVQGREQPALMTGSDLYDSYFGIKRLFPDDLGQMLDDYGFVAGNPVRTDEEDERARELLSELRARGVDPGWEPVAREELPPYPGDSAT